MATTPSKSIAVLGAGITGLTAALRLTQRGHRVRLFEASARVGGAIGTDIRDGWLVERGPNSILANDSVLTALIDELGLAPDRVAANAAARNRFIVRGGQLVAAPTSPPALLRSSLFSTGAKARILFELLQRPRVRPREVSLEAFVRDHFGQEIVDYGLNPFVGGVYAGNPKNLSARHAFPTLWETEQSHGSLLRGQIAAAKTSPRKTSGGIVSFRRGLQQLPEAVAARLPAGSLVLNAHVDALHREPEGRWSLHWTRRAGTDRPGAPHEGDPLQSESFDAVVAALPAPALAQLNIGDRGERPLAPLDAIEHPPVSSLFLGFRRDDVAHPLDGFGVLVPEAEKRNILGVLFSSTLFPGRAPADHVALTVLVGGTRNPDVARLSADALVARVDRDLRELLGVRGTPVFRQHTFWPRAIPQYNLGYDAHLQTMRDVEARNAGLWIGGQARDGISVPACVAAGENLARRSG